MVELRPAPRIGTSVFQDDAGGSRQHIGVVSFERECETSVPADTDTSFDAIEEMLQDEPLTQVAVLDQYDMAVANSNSDTDDADYEGDDDCDSDNSNIPELQDPHVISTLSGDLSIPDLDEVAVITDPSDPNRLDLRRFLQYFGFKANVSQANMNIMLGYFRNNGYPYLPADARTVYGIDTVSIPKETSNTMYIGILKCLQDICSVSDARPSVIKLRFNFDGLPLSGSSKQKIWPTLMTSNLSGVHVSVVGLFYGHMDPPNKTLLYDLVEELKTLKTFNYPPIGPIVPVAIDYVVCDSPANALVKGIKYPTGAYSCPKCNCTGLRNKGEGRAVFVTGPSDKLRTDQSFRSRENIEHHRERSYFEELDSSVFNMVNSFAIDGFHGVHIGGAQRTVLAIVGHYSGIERTMTAAAFEAKGVIWGNMNFPKDFSRHPRPFSMIYKWKATEWRMLVLYGLELMFTTNIHRNYTHILRNLCCAIRILSDPLYYLEKNALALDLIRNYLSTVNSFFGRIFMVSVVHVMVHLPQECRRFGPLDIFSVFRYENCLKTVKQLSIGSYKNPMVTLTKKLKVQSTFVSKASSTPTSKTPILKHEIEGTGRYQTIITDTIYLSAYKPANKKSVPADAYFYCQSFHTVLKMIYAEKTNDMIYLMCQRFGTCEAPYKLQMSHSGDMFDPRDIGIYLLKDLKPDIEPVSIRSVGRKYVLNWYPQYPDSTMIGYPLISS